MNGPELDALERILRSPLFTKAGRQTRFLRYVVEQHLAGEAASLRETSIALEVYDRPPSFDPKTDPIVRVEASRLRSRLREYYETEGADDPIRVDIPKGSYVPTFERRGEKLVAAVPAGTVALPVPIPVVGESLVVPQGVAVTPPIAVTKVRSKTLFLMVATAVLLAVVAIAILRSRSASRVKPYDAIAILPFADLSENHDLSYVAQGLTEQIQDELSRIRDLRIVGSASARQVSSNPDRQAAAKQVGADALIGGSVRNEGKKLRATVRLIDGASGSQLWTGSFDGERSSLFELEEHIAQAVAARLSIQLAVRREGVEPSRAAQRAQAHEYYQQARALGERESAAPLDNVYRLYQLAATTDPSYAPPHAALAATIIASANQLGGSDAKARSLEEARRAIALDPSLPAGYVAVILHYRDSEMNWTKGREACADSLQRFPNSGNILAACASIEGAVLNSPRQIALIRRAVVIDPLSPRMHAGLMFALYQAGQLAEALSEADLAVQLGSRSNFLFRHRALILAAMGKPEEGLKVLSDAEARLGGVSADWMPVRGYLLGRLGQRQQTEALIRDFTTKGASPHHLGIIYLGLDERDKALDHFEVAATRDPVDMAHVIPEYYMRVLDGAPRFEALKRRLGVVPVTGR